MMSLIFFSEPLLKPRHFKSSVKSWGTTTNRTHTFVCDAKKGRIEDDNKGNAH